MNSFVVRTWRLSQSFRQVASAMNNTFSVEDVVVGTIEDHVLVEWPLDWPASKSLQFCCREESWMAHPRHLGQPDKRDRNRAQISFRHLPTGFPIIPRRVVFHVTDEPFGALNAQAHLLRRSRTRRAMSSKSWAVQSACGPSTASRSIVSNVRRSPPNSGGSIRSNLATCPPRTRSTGEPAWASSKSSSRRDGASLSATVFTEPVCPSFEACSSKHALAGGGSRLNQAIVGSPSSVLIFRFRNYPAV